jgi:hypothetical protein
VTDLQQRLDGEMSDGHFEGAASALRAIEDARAQMLVSLKKRHQQEVQAELAAKKDSSERDCAAFTRDMEDSAQRLEAALQNRSDALTGNQMEECAAHDERWRSPARQRLFDRSSQQVRVLRVQQHYLMGTRRFDEAKHVSEIADRLSQAEARENHYQRFCAYQHSRARLDDKHAREEDTLERAHATRRGELQFEREKGERRVAKRFYNLRIEEERAQDAERLWTVCHRNDGDHLSAFLRSRGSPQKTFRKRPEPSSFNTLPLPPLPDVHSPRRSVLPTLNMRKSF